MLRGNYGKSMLSLRVSTFVLIGFHFGKNFKEILGAVQHHLKPASVALAAQALAYLLYRYFSKKRQESVQTKRRP